MLREMPHTWVPKLHQQISLSKGKKQDPLAELKRQEESREVKRKKDPIYR